MTAEQKQAETRSKLIDAAMSAFLSRGYKAASMEEISDRAGFSTGAIYSNFAGKEGLFIACLDQRTEKQMRMWAEFFTGAQESGVQPDSLGKMLVEVLPEQRWRRALLEFQVSALSESSTRRLLEGQRRWQGVVTRLLQVYCDSNGLTSAISLEAVAESLASLADGLSLNALVNADMDISAIFTRTVHSMVGTPSGSAPAPEATAVQR